MTANNEERRQPTSSVFCNPNPVDAQQTDWLSLCVESFASTILVPDTVGVGRSNPPD
jgi:hypothetical protein